MVCFITAHTVKAQANVLITMPDTYVCPGNNTILDAASGTCGTNYLWNNGATTQLLTVNQAGTYQVLVTYADGSNCEKTFVVKYFNSSLNNIVSTATSYCSGSNITLTTSGGCNYVWSSSDYSISNPAGSSIVVAPQSAGVYAFNVTGTSFYGCQENKTISITINQPPNISITASTETLVCAGTNVTLTGNGGVNYTWGNGATTQNINVTPQIFTTYNVTGVDANGCSNNASISLKTSTLCAILNPNFCNTTITNLTSGLVQAQAWITGATSYQFVFTPTDASTAPVVVNTPNAYTYLQHVNGLQYNTSYIVSIQASNSADTGPLYTAPCQLNIGPPTVVINLNLCNTVITNLSTGLVQAQAWIRYATYQYTFSPIGGGTPIILNSPSAFTTLTNVPGLQYNTSYNVSMQAFVGNIAGPISTATCPLVIGAPTVLVNSNFCNTVITNLQNGLVQAQAWIKYATYQYVFTDIATGNQITFNSTSAFVVLNNVVPALQYNTTYNVTMQAIVGNISGPISTATCNLVIGGNTSRMGNFGTTKENIINKDFVLFPNPTSSIIEITTDLNINTIELIDATGKSIPIEMIDKKIDLSKLNSGAYTLKAKTNEGLITRKFVKQD